MATSAIASQSIGLAISSAQLGAAVAQGFCYYRAFPHDKRLLKYLVITLLLMTMSATLLSCIMYWAFFYNCFRSTSPRCLLWNKTATALMFMMYTVPFTVQSFYCHRVWIISDRNIYVTTPIILFATSSYGIGLALIPPQILGAFASDGPLKMSTVGAFLGVICDCMISMSVYFYLRPSRSGIKRTDTRISSVNKNFVSMGILTCLLTIFVCILYWAHQFPLIGGAAMIRRNSYTNSLLAILNARKPLRQPSKIDIELPTIRISSTAK